MMREPHPFARFIAILGRGKSLTRSLTVAEAEEAMAMILAGDVLPEQLGAFLMLLRVKEETPQEIAGFVRAARARLAPPAGAPRVDLDWSSYAGKSRRPPWFVLSALALARNGRRVFMHGAEAHTEGRLYTGAALRALGLPVSASLEEAARRLYADGFAYLPIDSLSPPIAAMLELRPILGLRSPVHTFARMLNPFGATAMLQGVFHPGYMRIHRDAGLVLGQPRLAVFRGEGGEIERRPAKPCEVMMAIDGEARDERWPPTIAEPRQTPDDAMDLSRLAALWRGEIADAYGEAAVVGTLAIALRTLGAAENPVDAEAQARALWSARERDRLPAAA
ncbi:anthranilate phosphoribosyltransferase [Roseiarcus fermentans]|uniref:Anthranilate phosphoribosyltransferase n=1 Tax=Roseiarcus fermentans TaxID=1473586 RepID=A0A366ENX4_9HYPH|nr:glycosyl transferase family protein [Roseiarcus fermentans]RBP04091.1 anthranilate phosphoribosyltransferase [Roseiarcus fermentans]